MWVWHRETETERENKRMWAWAYMCVWVCVHVYVFGSLDGAVRRTLWLTAAIFALYFIRLLALTAQRGNFSSINNYTDETFWNVTLEQFHILCLTLISPLKAFVVVQLLSRICLWPHGLQHTRPPCPSPSPRACSNSCSLSRCCHPIISSCVVPFSSCLQSFPASGSFPVGRFFDSGKYWSFNFNISPTDEYSGLISFKMDWLDLLVVQGTLKSLLQHRSSKGSILWHSAFLMVQLSHSYMTTGKTYSYTFQKFHYWGKYIFFPASVSYMLPQLSSI